MKIRSMNSYIESLIFTSNSFVFSYITFLKGRYFSNSSSSNKITTLNYGASSSDVGFSPNFCIISIIVVVSLYSTVDNSNNFELVNNYFKSYKMKNENEWKINMY